MKPISLPLLVSALASIGLACGGLQSDTSSVDATAERVDLTVSSADWSTLLANRALYPPPPDGSAQGPGPGDRQPPPEAVQACAGHSAGQACSFTHDGHSITGTCRTPPDQTTLACAPDAPPPCGPGMPPQPPQELAVPGAIGSDPNSSNNALVWMPPAGPDGASRLLVHSTTEGYLLVPALDRQPPPGAPPPPAEATRVRLFVNHGDGAADSGVYLRLPPPPAP